MWPANYARQYQHCWRVAVVSGKLCEASCIAVKNRSRRHTVDESSTVKTLVSKRARECRCPRGNYLRHTHTAVPDLVDKFQQTIIAGMRSGGPFLLIQPAKMTVVIVQAAELQSCVSNLTHKPDNFVSVALFDSCAIHAGIYVEKDADLDSLPLPYLFLVLGEDGNADVRELIYYFAHAACVCAHHWIGEKHIRGAAAARHQQFERGCTLEIPATTLDQHADSVGQLCRLDVSTPAIRIAAEQM